jgi:predicted AlkP superfamily phosphohydrolase/phosphomutase
MGEPTATAARTVAIGLDGCSWNVLEPLLETGDLPNLTKMRTGGAWGVLESTIPFYTGPAWASFATAASPAAHGIFDFLMLREGGGLSVATQADLRRETYYEQLGRGGKRSVLVNLPLDQHGADNAVIVNSWLTADDSRRIFPLDRREKYRTQLDAYLNYPTTFTAPLDRHLDELCELEAARFELARALFLEEDWDHFFVLFSSTDWFGHAATGLFLQGDEHARAAFARLYRQLDGYIGWFAEQAPDATIAVLSDHGQCEETHSVRVNAVLRDLGLVQVLRERPDDTGLIFDEGEGPPRMTIRVPDSLGGLRSNPILRRLARLVKRVLRRSLNVDLMTPLAGLDVDRKASRAFSPTVASYAVYTQGCTDEEVQEIREGLLALRLDDGRPAFEGVWTAGEIYGRPAASGAPTLVFAPVLGVRPSISVNTPLVKRASQAGRGAHQRDGILILSGPHISAGELGRTNLYDVVPTLLWTMGEGIAADGDGRVLFEAFTPQFVADQPVREAEAASIDRSAVADDGSGEVERRLKALGYI